MYRKWKSCDDSYIVYWRHLMSLTPTYLKWLHLFWKNTKLSNRSERCQSVCACSYQCMVNASVWCRSRINRWNFSRHTGTIKLVAFKNSTMSQLLNVLKFPKGLWLYVYVHLWMNKSSLNRITLPDFLNIAKYVGQTYKTYSP